MITTKTAAFPIFAKMSEMELQKRLACRLEQDGYKVIQQCVDDPTKFADIDECKSQYCEVCKGRYGHTDPVTGEHIFGIDIVAQKNKELWIIEVKGQPNGGVTSCSSRFMYGMSQILTRMTSISEGIHYSLAIPNTDCFAPSVRKFMWSPVLPLLNLSIILIQDDGYFGLVK